MGMKKDGLMGMQRSMEEVMPLAQWVSLYISYDYEYFNCIYTCIGVVGQNLILILK